VTVRRIFPILDYGIAWGQEAIEIINNALLGKQNICGEVTLTANSATTTLADELITPNSVVSLDMPMTSNAAAALGTTYFSTPTKGSVTINHANNAQVDRTFRYTVKG